jgi:hypothetical protein
MFDMSNGENEQQSNLVYITGITSCSIYGGQETKPASVSDVGQLESY